MLLSYLRVRMLDEQSLKLPVKTIGNGSELWLNKQQDGKLCSVFGKYGEYWRDLQSKFVLWINLGTTL